MTNEEIHSPEEMAEFIVKTANKYNAKQITLCGGYRHTFMADYPCFKKLTSPVKHVVLYGEDATEEKALDALTKQLEDFLKEPVLTSGNY